MTFVITRPGMFVLILLIMADWACFWKGDAASLVFTTREHACPKSRLILRMFLWNLLLFAGILARLWHMISAVNGAAVVRCCQHPATDFILYEPAHVALNGDCRRRLLLFPPTGCVQSRLLCRVFCVTLVCWQYSMYMSSVVAISWQQLCLIILSVSSVGNVIQPDTFTRRQSKRWSYGGRCLGYARCWRHV